MLCRIKADTSKPPREVVNKKMRDEAMRGVRKRLKAKAETVMTTLMCPICNSSAQELPRTGDATGYRCPTHGDFKVADTVFAEAKAKAKAKGYTREQWEDALEKAEQRTLEKAEQRTESD
jgi:membrane-bound lytic murein transglycosylase B